jgi:transcriptional regulator GlxA family with amidase domain
MLAYAAAIECLRAANQVTGRRLYSWQHVSPDGHAAIASNDIEIRCALDTRTTELFDYVFVCASDEALSFQQTNTFEWLRTQAKCGAVLGGIGGGAFLLARAGLLKNRRLTLHWVYASAFSEEFPDADLKRSLYEIDDDRMTCGGGMSPLDMLHALLAREHGEGLALSVSDWFLHTEIREGHKPQRLSFQARLGVNHGGLIRALEAMEQAIEDPLPRGALARIARVSERQLDRLFLSQIGTPLGAYYLQMRLERARQLVLQSSLSQLEIAIACGFRSPSAFSKSYRGLFGVPPSTDRSNALRRRRRD